MNIPLSPFAVGRPLKATEPLFGREETFTLTHAALDRFESVNLVGERRMGKTSFLNHLMDNPQHRPAPGTPPLLLARVDLQNITDARRFYGLAMREILAALPDPAALTGSSVFLTDLQPSPDADFDSFERLLLQSLNKQALGEFATPIRCWTELVETGLIEAQRRQRQDEPIPQVYCGDGRPVRPDGRPDTEVPFKGRAALFRRLEQALGGTDGQRATYALFGQRRTGKTSALLQLERRLGSRVVAAFIDMQSEKLGGAADNASLLHGLAAAVNDEARRRDCILPDLTLRNLQNDPFPAFGRWLDGVEKSLGERRLLLCLDEFEALETGIADKRFDQRILTCLRNIVQHRRHVDVLLSGSHQIDELPPHWASALINTLSLPISFLEEDDARDLIEHPVADFPAIYRPEAVQCILHWSHRQPYLIQLLCQLLVERMNKAGRMPPASWVESADVDAIVPLALERGVSYFSDLWHSQSGGDTAKRLLETLAERPDTALDGTALQAIEPDRHLLNQVLRTLLRREIVERREDGRFAIIVPLVGEYVRSQRLV